MLLTCTPMNEHIQGNGLISVKFASNLSLKSPILQFISVTTPESAHFRVQTARKVLFADMNCRNISAHSPDTLSQLYISHFIMPHLNAFLTTMTRLQQSYLPWNCNSYEPVSKTQKRNGKFFADKKYKGEQPGASHPKVFPDRSS